MSADQPSTVDYLAQCLNQTEAHPSLLVTDQSALAAVARSAQTLCLSGPEALAAQRQAALPRAATAIVDGDADFDQSDLILPLISQLRDVLAGRVLVIAPRDKPSVLSRSALISLGFHRAETSLDEGAKRPWYVFEMAYYKVTPDWLNARHWANPELWDKFRW